MLTQRQHEHLIMFLLGMVCGSSLTMCVMSLVMAVSS